MKNFSIIIVFTFSICIISCKKDTTNESVTVQYNVGDSFKYAIEYRQFYDDTTIANQDSTHSFVDTFAITIEKDTIINGEKSLKLVYSGYLRSFPNEFIRQDERGTYVIAYGIRTDSSYEISILQNPQIKYPSNINVGMHWGESPDGKNNRQEVIDFVDIFINNNKKNCLKTRYNYYEEDEFYPPPTAQHYLYIDSKGPVMEEFSSTVNVVWDDFKGFNTQIYVTYRL